MAQETKTLNKFIDTEIANSSIIGSDAVKATSGLNNSGFVQSDFRIFTYKASLASGSRFTEITDFDDVRMLQDAGDRLYFGAPAGVKTWGIFTSPDVVKTSEKLIAKYYSTALDDLKEVNYMSMTGDCLDQNNNNLFLTDFLENFTIDKSIDADWQAKNNVLDKIPNTGDLRYWTILENPVGGVATPARLTRVSYRSNGTSQLDFNQQLIFWGMSRLVISQKIACVNFWNGGIPNIATLPITATHTSKTHKLRNAQNDEIHYEWSLPYGIDTSSPMEFCLSYSASQAINTADIVLDVKTVDHTNGVIGAGQTSDRIVTKNLNITGSGKVETTTFMSDYYVSDFLEEDIIFIELQRTDSNGGDFYPLELCINYPIYKIGKF
jgi:hypothetical protein